MGAGERESGTKGTKGAKNDAQGVGPLVVGQSSEALRFSDLIGLVLVNA
jgi:hypothetical protein